MRVAHDVMVVNTTMPGSTTGAAGNPPHVGGAHRGRRKLLQAGLFVGQLPARTLLTVGWRIAAARALWEHQALSLARQQRMLVRAKQMEGALLGRQHHACLRRPKIVVNVVCSINVGRQLICVPCCQEEWHERRELRQRQKGGRPGPVASGAALHTFTHYTLAAAAPRCSVWRTCSTLASSAAAGTAVSMPEGTHVSACQKTLCDLE